ncbi:hypothetical protein N656DRAFT_778784 [Canariomyces notabilis]|uniref:Oxidoreductase-like protein n=1 Tax=Canariomyces notabilis TaxID=2074819 RepID=A0AAN6TF17_9PEZI|nr:hypothetical protein N656DRAFT_778784 [Canariomyces arenarius]
MATRKAEARSLSDINYLAANPPQYPYRPEIKESLTLYISRVPGTHDIILSTFRPHKKNVTGEDITNSLYYVHLDSPEDGLLAVPHRFEDATSPRSSSESLRSVIPRKPLPATSKVPQQDHPVPGDRAPSVVTTQKPTESGAPAPGPNTFALSPTTPQAEGIVEGYRENPMFRKRRSGVPSEANTPSLAPPSLPLAGPIRRKELSSESTVNRAVDIHNHQEPKPYPERPATPIQAAQRSVQPATPPTSHLHPDRTPSPLKAARRTASSTFSLTIIRRDPTSGSQCNVGKVSSFETNVPTPDRADPSLDPENMGIPHVRKINIHIETSGYAKFRDMPSRASVDAYRPTTGLSFTQQVARESGTELGRERATSLRPHPSPLRDHHLANDSFTRQVVMSYAQSWKTNLKKAFHIRDRPSTPEKAGSISPVDLTLPRPHHTRQGSASTINSTDSDGSPTVITQPGPGLKPKGYVFFSPWDGRCEFRTSTNGRSLKCRHVLGPANAKIDARDLAHNLRDAQAMGRSRGDELSAAMVGAKPVSELRFNIPGRRSGSGSSAAGGNSDGGGGQGRRRGHLSEQFGRLLHRESHSSDEEEDDGVGYDEDMPMDLSLGREHAGGGNNGKRAKLGKLIIHDEGLKMLDLVVAANIGVWWVTWGRTF